jgi:hypothetical protein
MLQELTLGWNFITSVGVGVLLGTSSHITDLDLHQNSLGTTAKAS